MTGMDKRQRLLGLRAGVALVAGAVIAAFTLTGEPETVVETADAPAAETVDAVGASAVTASTDTTAAGAVDTSDAEALSSTAPDSASADPETPGASDAAVTGGDAAAAPNTTAPAAPSTTAAVSTSTADAGSATGTTVPGPAPSLLIEGSPMTRFSIEVGAGVDLDRHELARSVIKTLSDERSWRGRGYGFELVDSGGQFTLIVATPSEVDRMCRPLRTNGYFSCSANGWVALNSDRWFGATSSWTAGLAEYRHYLVNHEIGHQLGQGHVGCPGAGQPAPVMMQQTKGVGACLPNGWVDP